jgi:hypothetical protein
VRPANVSAASFLKKFDTARASELAMQGWTLVSKSAMIRPPKLIAEFFIVTAARNLTRLPAEHVALTYLPFDVVFWGAHGRQK